MMLCMHTEDDPSGRTWVCVKPVHDEAPNEHFFTPVASAVPVAPDAPTETTTDLRCEAEGCGCRWTYKMSALRVSLYTHGVCTVSFFCLTCHEQTEFTVPDSVALLLDKAGAPATVVHTPEEVLEWPAGQVPAIQEFDVGIVERSSLRHFNECVYRELGSTSVDGG